MGGGGYTSRMRAAPAALFTHVAVYCDPTQCRRHTRPRLHSMLRESWTPVLRVRQSRARPAAPMAPARRLDAYLGQTGRVQLTVRQRRQYLRMDARRLRSLGLGPSKVEADSGCR